MMGYISPHVTHHWKKKQLENQKLEKSKTKYFKDFFYHEKNFVHNKPQDSQIL